MREFNKVSAKYWMTPLAKRIKQIGIEVMYLSIYLQTNHHTHSFGVFYLPIDYIAHDTGLSIEEIEAYINKLSKLDFCRYDFEQEYIWLKNYALEQSSGALKPGDSRIIQAQKYFEELPALNFLQELYCTYKEDFHLPEIELSDILPPVEVPLMPHRGTETETKRETKTETETKNVLALPRHGTASKSDCFVFEHWKKIMNHPNAQLDKKRQKLISEAIKLGYDEEALCHAITGCAQTPHNMGMNENNQRYDGLHVILRDADQIDRFIRNYHEPPRQLSKTMQSANITYHALQDWIEGKEDFANGSF